MYNLNTNVGGGGGGHKKPGFLTSYNFLATLGENEV